MWFNPFVAQVDVICGTESGVGGSCQIIAAVTNQGNAFDGDFNGNFGINRDSYWPRSVAAMTITGLILHRPVRPARLADPAVAPSPATPTPTARPEVKPDAAVARAPPRHPTDP